ncbi:aspartic proteinase 36-like [Musa acuminata AAA Group]|uniref:Peptidase A1 domain-containing protein n=1 Tax=Musa acuminata subsp. malaccensis TaxID=214687 RepID=A0A804IM08_MUSAM|nr:PREDICTED: aspartic proteinase nepenthesin-1-like [Musa acuminata subsp. malaccensis]
MARSRDRGAAASCFLFLLFLVVGAAGTPEPSLQALSIPGGRSHLVLPLVLSRANSTRRSAVARRFLGRQLTANARMRLYDDLLTNGYYTTRLFIGTPPQEFALIVDSGSTVTYVPCSTCEQCGNHQDPRFQPDLSSTYEPVKCNVDCTCDKEQKQCVYERQYAEMSSSSGVLGEDFISFGKESELKPQRAVFGCENSETGDLFSQHADGIIGLGRGQLSIMDQLVEKGVINDSFSLCYGGMDIGGGAMVLGEITPPPDMVFSRSDPVRSPYYNIELKEIDVDGKPLQLDPKIFDSRHGTVLDSGTTYAYLPEEAFIAFRDAIMSKLSLKQIPGPDPNYKDICFSGAGSDVSELSKFFPKVEMVFGNGENLSLSPENYLFRHSKVSGAYCLGIFQNGKDLTTLLGGIIVRNTLVSYDRQNEKIGFWKTNCSVLWERLHIGGVPSPAPSENTHATMNDSPAPSPSDLFDHFEIGLITFDMTLNITYAKLLPHTEELAELIAHELEVDKNQVHLINITSEGNGTLMRWSIFPAGSSNFFSNTTVMDIISRLTEHRVHLPEDFGSYQLVEWNVEPPSRRTWWQWHTVALLVGVSMVILLSFTTLTVWYIWRRNKGPGQYRPVDSPLPEQELQPL